MTGPEGPAGPAGQRGQPGTPGLSGTPGRSVTEEEVRAMINQLLQGKFLCENFLCCCVFCPCVHIGFLANFGLHFLLTSDSFSNLFLTQMDKLFDGRRFLTFFIF